MGSTFKRFTPLQSVRFTYVLWIDVLNLMCREKRMQENYSSSSCGPWARNYKVFFMHLQIGHE